MSARSSDCLVSGQWVWLCRFLMSSTDGDYGRQIGLEGGNLGARAIERLLGFRPVGLALPFFDVIDCGDYGRQIGLEGDHLGDRAIERLLGFRPVGLALPFLDVID